VDIGRLRQLLLVQIHDLSQRNRHEELPGICERLGLPAPPPKDQGSKAKRMSVSFEAAPDIDFPDIAKRLLADFPPGPAARNEIEEVLWANRATVSIVKRFRREVATALELADLWLDGRRFQELLDRLWVLDAPSPICGHHGDGRLRDEIEQHVFKNDDLTADMLFDALGAYDCSNHRFVLFLEGLAAHDVRPDVTNQRRFVQKANEPLRPCGVELWEAGEDGGYPVFKIIALSSASVGRPKNLIFASPVKPDLRFRDAVNNDIEIVTNADKVLVYDRPIGLDGLLWRDLQAWWAEAQGFTSKDDAKTTLYRRLQESLPVNSPPQRHFFRAFFQSFRNVVPDLPALLPEVWLHWDPKTVKERGSDALARFRMDFLLLLPANVRVVIEVDGKDHYADEGGRANATKYAAMMAADRELRLAGYDVYRFGAAELLDGVASACRVKSFFEALFRKYGVTAP
jgi:hypothetical protein